MKSPPHAESPPPQNPSSPEHGTASRARPLVEFTPLSRFFAASWHRQGKLDHAVMDLHYYFFSDYSREAIRGKLLRQVR